MKKRIFTMILVICMVLSIVPMMGTHAADDNSTATNRVYVFAQVTGDTTGIVLNNHGWCTLGYVDLANSYAEPEVPGADELRAAITSGRFTAVQNKNLDITDGNFSILDVKWVRNAEDLASGMTIHLDIAVNREPKYGAVNIRYEEKGTGKVLAEEVTDSYKAGEVLNFNGYNAYVKTIEGYDFEYASLDSYMVEADTTETITCYYTKKGVNRVYVFTKVEGDTTGLEINAHGWYTLGYVDLDSKYTEPELPTLEEVKAAIANGKFTSVHNESIDINEVEFKQSGIFWETDAEDMGRGRTIHMDGILYRKAEEPVKPSEPENPTKPEDPTTPTEPSTPEDPTTPSTPAEPTTPATPSTPSEPTTPSTPAEPTTPAMPSTPVEPTTLSTPVTPNTTSETTTPASVVAAADPLNPAEAVEPAVLLAKAASDQTAAAEETKAVEEIPEDQTPLSNYEGSWSLLNLLLTIGTAFLSVLLIASCFGKKEKKADEQTEQTVNKKIYRKAGSIIPAVAAVLLLVKTSDFRLQMVLVNRWTLWMLVIAFVQVILAFVSKKSSEEEKKTVE